MNIGLEIRRVRSEAQLCHLTCYVMFGKSLHISRLVSLSIKWQQRNLFVLVCVYLTAITNSPRKFSSLKEKKFNYQVTFRASVPQTGEKGGTPLHSGSQTELMAVLPVLIHGIQGHSAIMATKKAETSWESFYGPNPEVACVLFTHILLVRILSHHHTKQPQETG